MSKLYVLMLIVFAAITVLNIAQAQLRPLNQVEKSFFVLNNSRLSQRTPISSDSTTKLCMDNGGVPANLAEFLDQSLIYNIIYRMTLPTPTVFFAGASARPTNSPNGCLENETTPWTSTLCSYRFRFGFYDQFSSFGEPGIGFFRGLKAQANPVSQQYLNGYFYPQWSGKTVWSSSYPHGYYQVLALRQPPSAWKAVDAPEVAQQGNPAPLTSYIAVCEVQKYVINSNYRSTEMPQPTVVPGWKELTWAQQNWWVIFLIVAIIILAILIAIIIFCYCSAIEKKPGPPIYALVLRERVGSPYIIAKENADNSEIQKRVYISSPAPDPALAPEPESEPLRQGRGFNFNPLVNPDPEDMAQNVPVVYNTDGERQLYSDGDSIVAEEY